MRTKQPPKPVSPEVARLRAENDGLRATNEQLRRALQVLAERQRERAQEQAALDADNGEKHRG